jgi:MFS family permease
MPRPENVFIDSLFFINAFLSLLPAVFIFIKKKYFKEVLAFLMILCLLNFIENVVLIIIPLSQISNQNIIRNIFSLVELMLIVQMFSSALNPRHKERLTVLSIIFLAVIVTFYFSKGMGEKRTGIEMTMQVIIIAIAGIISFRLVEKDDVMIFNYPLLWIAIGTLFYFLIALLVNIINSGAEGEKDRIILLNIASFIRYIFYALAVLYHKDDNGEEHSSFR